MSFLQKLPVEVVSMIVDACDKVSLLGLCLTSRSNQLIAQKSLYRQIDLRSVSQCIMYFRTLSTRPELAVAARELLIMFDSNDSIFPVFWTRLSDVLALTNNLFSLHLAMQGPSDVVFRRCTFSRLRMFSSVMDISLALHDFLVRHPSIKQLCLGGELSHERLSLPVSALPALESYLGSRSLARDIIPGRPVSQVTLAWTSGLSDEEITDFLRMLATGAVPMRHFRCATFDADPYRIIRVLANHMPGLHTLRITTMSSRGPPDEDVVATALQSFKELQQLDIPCLSNAYVNPDMWVADEEAAENEAVVKWKKSCTSLETVTFPSCMRWYFSQEDQAWKRRVDDSADVKSNNLF